MEFVEPNLKNNKNKCTQNAPTITPNISLFKPKLIAQKIFLLSIIKIYM